MRPRELHLLKRVVRFCSIMWRHPQPEVNLSWLNNLQQQQFMQTVDLPAHFNPETVTTSQDSGQSHNISIPSQVHHQPSIHSFQSVNHNVPCSPYPFVYTNGEQAVQFYENFSKYFTGRKTPEFKTHHSPATDVTPKITDRDVATDTEVNQKCDLSEPSTSAGSTNSGGMKRGSKRNHSDSGGLSNVNCKKGMQTVENSGSKSEKFVDGDVIMCSTHSPKASVIDLTGASATSPTEKSARPIQRKFFVTPYGREQEKYRKQSRHSSIKFSVASYNVLSQSLLRDNSYLYRYSEEDWLTWESRSSLILDQISRNHPDVLCLQEVEESHFQSFFLPELTKKGYKAVYKKRTGSKPDGCAIFYNSCIFGLEASSKVEYFKKGVPYLDRDNVGLVLLLSVKKATKTKLCVATTHLLFNPRRGDVKLAQLQVLLAEIDKLASRKQAIKPWKSTYHPVIFCGDLNLQPYSDLYEFILSGVLSYQGLMCRDMSGQDEGRGGSNKLMTNYILPEELGISDQCQYEEVFRERFMAYNKSHSQKKKQGRSGKAENEKVLVVEDGEIVDDEVAGPSNPALSSATGKDMTEDEDDCVILNTSSSSEAKTKKLESSSGIDDNVSLSSDVAVSKSPDSYSQFREMTKKNKEQLAAYAVKMQTDSDLENVVVKHCSHNKGRLSHQLNLVSVYPHEYINKNNQWSKEVTTNHARTNCTVDYIFYSVDDKEVTFSSSGSMFSKKIKEGKLRLLEKLELFVDEELNDCGGLPNEYEGSDHIMLFAKFQLKLK